MAIRFKPMSGLTAVVLICLPILIGLGVWQYQRWHWKMDLLTEIEMAVTAPPINGLAELSDLSLGRGLSGHVQTPLDFRRIRIDGDAVGETWHYYRPAGAIQWQPFRQVQSGPHQALVGFPSFDDTVKESVTAPILNGPRTGYVRRLQPRTGLEKLLGADSNPDQNRWFDLNPDGAWVESDGIYIDLHPTETDPDALPIRRPDIPNNHVSYMLTWWSFALILLIIYAILHRRAGRLSLS